jgi:hypothetical protein
MLIVADVSSAFYGEENSAFPDEEALATYRRSRGCLKKF